MATQLLMSAGRKTSERSLMIISRSVSRNSRTRFRFVFDENTSKSFRKTETIYDIERESGRRRKTKDTLSESGDGGEERMKKCTHLDDVRMVQLTQVLDFSHGGHVKAILKLTDLDLLNGDLTTRRELST
jgi:hypothetical protein